MAHDQDGKLGSYLPYLLVRRLRAVVWPPDGGTRAVLVLLGVLAVVYGLGLGFVVRHGIAGKASFGRNLLLGLNVTFFFATLLVDFLPTYRPVQRPLPEHFPVSERRNVVLAYLLDLISVRRLLLALTVLVGLLSAGPAWQQLLLPLALLLSAATVSFNVRMLLSMGRWRHPLLGLHLACLGLVGAWLAADAFGRLPLAANVLAWLVALVPLGLWVGQLVWLGPLFSARYQALRTPEAYSESRLLARLSPEWKAYLRKAWPALGMGLAFKVLVLVISSTLAAKEGEKHSNTYFYLFFLPAISFTYVNNNLYGYLHAVTANELERLGLTRRLLRLYLRLVVPVVLVDCLISVVAMLALFPPRMWPQLGLLPLAAPAMLAIGIWGSLYRAKPVRKHIDFGNMRNNASTLISVLSLMTAAALYFIPWWGVRIGVALAISVSAWMPMQRILRNDGPARRQLWRSLEA